MRRVESPRRTLSHLLVRCPFFLPNWYGFSHRRPDASLRTKQLAAASAVHGLLACRQDRTARHWFCNRWYGQEEQASGEHLTRGATCV
jgi:hypothetical protein